MVEQQPSLARLDGDGTCTNLHALPCTLLEGCRSHHVAVATPKLHVGRLAIEDVAKRRVSRVGRAGEHRKATVDLSGEEHAVAVVGQEGVLQLVERLEVLRPRHANGRAVIAVAPGDVVAVFDEGDARVVAIDPLAYLFVLTLEAERVGVDVPMEAVVGEAHVEHHAAVGVVATEHAREAIAERYDGRIEDTIARGEQVARDDRVFRIAPHGGVAVGRAVLPRHIGEGVALDDEFAHILLVCYWSVVVGDYERWTHPLSKGRMAHPRFPSYFLGSG